MCMKWKNKTQTEFQRDFFFGVLNSLRPEYLKKIIEDANKVRYVADVNAPEKDFIMIDEDWYKELIKFPYFSSNTYSEYLYCLAFRKTWSSNIPHEGKS